MRRREFITLIGGVAATWPVVARAQADRVPRVGVLMATSDSDPESQVRVEAFQQSVQKLGRVVGRSVQIDYRWGFGNVERTAVAAAELVKLAPDVILSNATTATRALQKATATIPIVFVVVSEPVAQGFIPSLARPGGNMTGFTYLEPTIGAKWLELLREIEPRISRVAILFNPRTAPNGALFARSAETAATRLGVDPVIIHLGEPTEIEAAIRSAGRGPASGLIMAPDTFTVVHRKIVVELAARYQLPAIYFQRPFAVEGGLISYGADITDIFRRAASYIDRILRGEKPADLPVQQPTKFELVVNLKTAKALALTVPPKLLFTADEVIE